MVEPWLRGTLLELDSLRRGVVHALWLASEDVGRWCKDLPEQELEARPFGLPSVGFQMRHSARSLDRLLTYAEGGKLNARQTTALETEMEAQSKEDLFREFEAGLSLAESRMREFLPGDYGRVRWVGRELVSTTVGALLLHCADHTQRHAGQMVTTAKIVAAMRGSKG